MRNLATAILALAILMPASAKTFEGIVYYTMTTGKHTMQSEYAIKDKRVKMTMAMSPKQTTESIFDAETGEAFVIMREQGMFMRFGGLNEVAESAVSDDMTFEKTGESDTIAGYRCQKYIIRDQKSEVELWATEGLGKYVSFGDLQKNKGKNAAWANVMLKENLFPLKTVVKDKKGRVQMTMVADKVEKKKLDAAPFEVPPPGLTEFKMPNIGGLLKGLGGG